MSEIEEPKKKRKLLPFIIILSVILVFVAGFSYYYFVIRNKIDQVDSSKIETPAYSYGLDEMLVNLNESTTNRYLKIIVYLGYDEKKLNDEIATDEPFINDAVISVLRSKCVSDLTVSEDGESENEKVLKQEIIDAVNPLLENGELKEVYFTEFIVN
ncbi:MAG: flagellar basal body-associated protein FliL [Clostridiaceae bacterium]